MAFEVAEESPVAAYVAASGSVAHAAAAAERGEAPGLRRRAAHRHLTQQASNFLCGS